MLPSNEPLMSTPAGVIMKVTHAFAMNIKLVPMAFKSSPTPRCAHLSPPEAILCHP